ncbi:MAG: ATP-binding cassette domain-containing protein [Candidatus Eisenbacteria bacterium]
MIELSSVWFTYPGRPSPALRGVDLTVVEGETLSVIGRNASGKSTLCGLVSGVLEPDRGTITVDGVSTPSPGGAVRSPAEDARSMSQIRRRVVLLQQNPESQFVSVTVEREIAAGPENLGFSPVETKAIVDELLDFFGLRAVRRHPPGALSGGQMQKVLIASLVAMRPAYLVLDEPTSYLDPFERLDVSRELMRMSRELGTALIWVTQFLQEAVSLPRVVALEQGTLCFDGPSEELKDRGDVLDSLRISRKALERPAGLDRAWRLGN